MKEIILSSEQLQEIEKSLGKQISDRFRNSDSLPVFVGVMKGALNFMMDLIKYVDVPMVTDYIQISSYEGTESTGIIHLKKDLTLDVTNRSIIIIEDVIDTGFSLHYLKNYFINKFHPKEVIICCLIDKQASRKIDTKVDYVGYTLKENKFLMGYGLDYNELCRNINCVYVPEPEEIKEYDRLLTK